MPRAQPQGADAAAGEAPSRMYTLSGRAILHAARLTHSHKLIPFVLP